MSGPVAATIYAHQLTYQGQGYPLWDPDPQDEPAVEIADVGYVKNGAFVRLFNASKPPGDECNKLGVPAQYHPLHVGEIQKRTSLPANVPVRSESVFQLGAQASISGGAFTQAGGGFSFECSKQQGAVLIIGDDADRRDALCQLPFLRYIREYHGTWLTFANKVRQRGIVLNDLVLVTGCDKTSAWACAAFSGKSTQAEVSFQVGQMGVAQGSVSLWGTWKNSSSATTQSGPRRAGSSEVSRSEYPMPNDRPIQADYAGGGVRLGESHSDTIALSPPPIRDQCVFLRGYKMCDRQTAIARLLARKKKPSYDGFDYASQRKEEEEDPDASGPSGWRDLPPGQSGHAGGSSRAQPSTGGSEAGNTYNGSSGSDSHNRAGDQNTLSGPDPSASDAVHTDASDSDIDEDMELCVQINQLQDPSPLDVLLDYILEKSKVAELAVVHDADLISLIKCDQGFKSVYDFEVWIREVGPAIFLDDNQVGMLETTYRLLLSDSTHLKSPVGLESKSSTGTHALNGERSSQLSSRHRYNEAHTDFNDIVERQRTMATPSPDTSDTLYTDPQHPYTPEYTLDASSPNFSYDFKPALSGSSSGGVQASTPFSVFKDSTHASHSRSFPSRTLPVGNGGCWTCRLRRMKCDEQGKNGPCQTCLRLKIACLGWGSRRPDWMRDKAQVEAYKADIEGQLSSQGMIRGQPRTPVIPTGGDTPPVQYKYAKIRHKLRFTGDSDEGDEHPSEQGGSASTSPSYSPIEIPQLTPNPSTAISDLDLHLYPTSGGLHTLPIMPSPYGTSSPLSMGESHNMMSLSVLSQSYYEPNAQTFASSPSNDKTREHGVSYYFRCVRQIQFPFAGSSLTSIFHDLVVREPMGVLTNAICALATLHKNQIRVAEGLEDPNADNSLYFLSKQFYDVAWWQLLDSKQRHGRYTEQDATAGVHLVSYWLFCGGGGDWQSPLDVAIDWLAESPLNDGANPHVQWLQLSALAKFTARMTMWLDITSAIGKNKVPRFMDLYRRLFHADRSYWVGSSHLHMDALTGCPNAVMYALSETASLAHWKIQQTWNHSLSVRELLRRSDAIEQDLRSMSTISSPENFPHLIDQPYDLNAGAESGASSFSSVPSPIHPAADFVAPTTALSTPEHTIGVETRRLVSNVFFETALLYMQSVVNDHNPIVPEIMEGVNAIMQALSRLAPSEVDRGLVFPICLAGCLTDVPEQREFFKQRLDAQDTSLGNLSETRRLMEAVWRKRDNQGGVVDWRHTMPDIGIKLLVV